MADLTNRLFLSIYARNLTGSGFAGVAAGLHGLGGAAGMAATALGVGLVGALGASVKQASDYQKMITVAGNNTTLTTKGIQQMSDTVKKLGSETGAPLDQLATGFRKAVNFGFSGSDASKLLGVATKAALATGANVGDTAGVLANVMHEYNTPVSKAASTMNVLHTAAAQGNATLQDFTTTGARAIDMAANLHIPLTQVAATLSSLSRHESLADANTQVVGMLSKIVNPAKAAQKELAKLTLSSGIDLLGDFSPTGLKSKGITGVMADLKAATGGNIQEMFQAVPALRGGMAAMLLTGTAGGDYKNIKGSLDQTQAGKTNPVGTAYTSFSKTLGSTLGIVRRNVQLLAIAFGTNLLPAVTRAAGIFSGVLKGALQVVQNPSARVKQLLHDVGTVAGSMAGTLGTAARLFGQVAGAIGRLLSPLVQTTGHLKLGDGALRTIGKTLGGVTLAIGLFATGLKLAALWEGITKTATEVWTAAQKLLNFALKDNPIGLVVLALGGLVLGLTYAYDHSKTFRDMVNGVWAFLQSSFGPVLTSVANILKTALAAAVDYMSDHAKSWWDMLKNVWNFLSSTFGPILKTVAGILTTILVVEIQATIDVVKSLWSWGGTLVNFWTGTLQPAIGTLAGAFSGVLKTAITDTTTIVKGLWQGAHDLWNMLVNILKPAIQPIADIFTNVFGKALGGIADKIGGLISSFGGLLKMLGQKVSTYGLDQIKKTVDSIKAGDTGKGGSGAWGNGKGRWTTGAPHGPAAVPFVGPGRGLIAARFGAAYNHGGAPSSHGHTGHGPSVHHGLTKAQQQRAWNIEHPNTHKGRTPVQNAQLAYSTDLTRWKMGQRGDGQIERDIAALAKLDPKKAGLLQAQFDTAVHHRNEAIRHHAAATQQREQRRNDAIRHAATAAQQRMEHRNAAIRHAGAVAAHHAQILAAHKAAAASRTRHHQEDVNLRAQYQNDNTQFATDMRDKNFSAARTMIAALTTLKRTMEIRAGVSASQATKDAATYSDNLLSKLDAKTGLVKGLKALTAPRMGSGFHKSVYGYTSRQQVGQGVGLGETLVTFGGRVGKDPAQQMIEKLDAQVQQLTQQNAALTALLSVAEEGRDATVRVGDLLARPPRSTPGSGIGNPLRVQGLATAVR